MVNVTHLCVSVLTWTFLILIVNARRHKREFRSLRWNDCGRPDQPLHLTSVDISPIPVVLPGTMYITLEGYSSEAIPSAALRMTIQRDTIFGHVTVPCLFNIGSCTYHNMCTLLDTMIEEDWAGISRQVSQEIKSLLQSAHVNNTCPIPRTRIQVADHPFQLPQIPAILIFLAEGDYSVKFQVVERPTNRPLGCLNVGLPVKKQETNNGWFFRKRRHA